MNIMQSLFIIHSLNNGTKKSFGQYLIRECSLLGLNVIFPEFSIGKEANYHDWSNVMEFFNSDKIEKTEFGLKFDYNLDDREYSVQIIYPNKEDNYSTPYILVIPKQLKDNCLLAVEVNNLETEDKDKLLDNGLLTAYCLTKKLKEFDNPVVVPIIPSVKNGIPYYQQLSRECFLVSEDNPFYRIDLQVLNIINDAKRRISENVEINDKIFLNGYSASGVFAQRFALLHPEIVDTLCVGGEIGSIPLPIKDFNYPLGIADYSDITGKKFDFDSYSQINFRYYVGSLEDKRKTSERYDENGEYAPMHDMSYFDRSVPFESGKKLREMFGKNMFERSEKQFFMMNEMGMNVGYEIFEGRTHNNYKGIIGVKELADKFVNRAYRETLTVNKKY